MNVNLVQLNVAVTDNKGNYITGLRPRTSPSARTGSRKRLPPLEKATTHLPCRPRSSHLLPDRTPGICAQPQTPGRQTTGPRRTANRRWIDGPDANVFILFDTSNYMYRGFVFAQDAIADFVRSLAGASKVAFYSYSRDLSRVAPLTSDRSRSCAEYERLSPETRLPL